MSQSEPFMHPLSHQEVTKTMPSALILMSPIWDILIFSISWSSRYHRQFVPLNQMDPYDNIAISRSSRPRSRTNCSLVHCPIKKWPLRYHWHWFQWAHMRHSHLDCSINNWPSWYHRHFAFPNQICQSKPFICSLFHQEVAETISSAQILMSQCEGFASLLSHQPSIPMIPSAVCSPESNGLIW